MNFLLYWNSHCDFFIKDCFVKHKIGYLLVHTTVIFRISSSDNHFRLTPDIRSINVTWLVKGLKLLLDIHIFYEGDPLRPNTHVPWRDMMKTSKNTQILIKY